MTKRYASLAEAADYLGCDQRTIRRYVASGKLSGYRLGPKLIRFDLDELDALLTPIPSAGRAVIRTASGG